MSEQKDIREYYDELAKDYDLSRFGNTYGEFINKQEEKCLVPILRLFEPTKILNLGCGTGRFMEYCHFGMDFSEKMLAQAQTKYPSKDFILADAAETTFPSNSFDLIFSMHTFMHLNKEKSENIFKEVFRLLRPGGRFVFDVPSTLRRNLFKGHRHGNWHGSNSYGIAEIKETLGEDWEYIDHKGILFLPVHRIPSSVRPYFFGIDTFLCRNLPADYSSYMIIIMQKTKY
ncbi:MAG: ubiquinone/menaquinone biosynthesis C-methylase UbiE [Maribacter sp.]|jgi:ubiquinone/menaquinone biosynthesis C-methylase UbiE